MSDPAASLYAGIVAAARADRPSIVVVSVDRAGRVMDGLLLLFAVAWLTYTAGYFLLHPRGLTFDPSLFMDLTGKPDPACGLTRTFAWMWRGDIIDAVRVYPLGPVLFVSTILATANSAAAVVLGKTFRVEMSRGYIRVGSILLIAAFAANWASKLLWLGM